MLGQQKHEKLLLVAVLLFPNQGILNHATSDNLLTAFIYVAYRSQHPDEETVKEVLKKLQENNIDISQLVYLPTDHCQ
jgi:hypothetical protein